MKTRLLFLVFALTIGGALLWSGASALFAAGVDADRSGTAGAADPVWLVAAAAGLILVVSVLCVTAWEIGKLVAHRTARRRATRA